ncbi:hypothetical protein [uncultured Dietzia sp.]|uniref:hypothetical protein n=1 Tax=uncultured Dietzia sp. TaxID=395519 RepID=UPI0025D21B43|nr:hypothetical protein [uncultured Dietzia sp.]
MATHLRWALAAAAVAGVSILSVQQTGALWSDSAESSGATISSGRLDIAVGTSESQVEAYSFTGLEMDDMMSGDFVQRPLHVYNTGSVPMQYRLVSTELGADLPLNLRVAAVSSETDCLESGDTAGNELYAGELKSAFTADRGLAVGAWEILCFRVEMVDDSTSDDEGSATFTFQATQS